MRNKILDTNTYISVGSIFLSYRLFSWVKFFELFPSFLACRMFSFKTSENDISWRAQMMLVIFVGLLVIHLTRGMSQRMDHHLQEETSLKRALSGNCSFQCSNGNTVPTVGLNDRLIINSFTLPDNQLITCKTTVLSMVLHN